MNWIMISVALSHLFESVANHLDSSDATNSWCTGPMEPL